MNRSQEQLLRLLTLAIHGGIPTYESFSSINGKELFNLALQQNVSAFLYPTLNRHREDIKLDELSMRRWKETTLFMATRQMIMINEIGIIFDLFKTNGIPAISLKGLALKQLYPQPELRNMGDLDLFIDEINIQRSIELLITHGYYPNSEDLNNPKYMHIGMRKPGSFPVEIHRTLWHPTIMKKINNDKWFDHIWKNKRLLEMKGFQYSALSTEDELINLIIHLARHFMHSSANLQQLCDIILFINTYWDTMDSEYINQTIKSMDLFTFYQYLLSTSQLYFGLTIPIYSSNLDQNKSEILLNDIFSSKMHCEIRKKSECWRSISDRYPLARNNQFFIPLALVLEIGRQFVRKMNTILHYIPFTEKSIKVMKIFSPRARFLRSIGLH